MANYTLPSGAVVVEGTDNPPEWEEALVRSSWSVRPTSEGWTDGLLRVFHAIRMARGSTHDEKVNPPGGEPLDIENMFGGALDEPFSEEG